MSIQQECPHSPPRPRGEPGEERKGTSQEGCGPWHCASLPARASARPAWARASQGLLGAWPLVDDVPELSGPGAGRLWALLPLEQLLRVLQSLGGIRWVGDGWVGAALGGGDLGSWPTAGIHSSGLFL